MRLFVVFFAVVFLVNTNVMGQDSVMWLRLKDFEELLESGRLKGKIDTITIIVLENNNNTLQTPLSTNQELPEGAVLFSYMGEI